MTQKETLLNRLFKTPGQELVDVKFCRGTSEAISEEAFCAEANTAMFQLENGLVQASETFDETHVQVDVKKLSFPA